MYVRPGVTVTQQFVNQSPALAAFALPSVVVGPAYQLVDSDAVGSYTGEDHVFSYASLIPGSMADLEPLSPTEQFPATKKPVSVSLKNTVVAIADEADTGSISGANLNDPTTDAFINVLVGDKIVIIPQTAVEIVAAQTDGSASSPYNRLTASTARFANVKVGDTVHITGGTDAVLGDVTVLAKISDTIIVVSGPIASSSTSDLAYNIVGDRGVANAGTYTVKTKTDSNNLVLSSPVIDSPEAPLSYSIQRAVGTVVLARVSSLPGNGFLATDAGIQIPAGLQVTIGSVSYDIARSDVEATYRALRIDMANEVKSYADIDAITAAFGANQITPANPLAYGLQYMAQNTVTEINGLGLGEDMATDEAIAFTSSLAVLGTVDMYAIAVLSQNPVVHTAFTNHVNQYSDPTRKLERVAIINSTLALTSVLQDETTTDINVVGARTIVATQSDGQGAVANPNTLVDMTTDQFLNVAVGDTVRVISAGTGVNLGDYAVTAKADSNHLTVSGTANLITSGSPTGIVYVIVRKDGLGADGITLYDRNASFLTNDVGAGHFVTILAGSFAGRFRIATVNSEKQVTLSVAIAGVAALQTALNYQVDRDLSKNEQAANVAGYSSSLRSRRMVHVWPDKLQTPFGQSIVDVPGYYLGCAIAALTSGLPTQQGFTNMAVSGFLGFYHSTKYFTELQLDAIADGGTMVFAQQGPSQPLYVRHQLTTDRSSIKFQEYSVTKNVDFMAKFLRTSYGRFIGPYNIVDTTLDELKTTGKGCIKFLVEETKRPKIGGVARSGTLKSIAEDDTQIDTVLIRFGFNIPIPLNHIGITIEV